MLLMADFNAIECRSPAVPPTVCDFGREELCGMEDGEGAERAGEDVLFCAAVWLAGCGASCDGEDVVDGSAVSARAWDAGGAACWWCWWCWCCGPGAPDGGLLSLSR
jgi:hypothetical protein